MGMSPRNLISVGLCPRDSLVRSMTSRVGVPNIFAVKKRNAPASVRSTAHDVVATGSLTCLVGFSKGCGSKVAI